MKRALTPAFHSLVMIFGMIAFFTMQSQTANAQAGPYAFDGCSNANDLVSITIPTFDVVDQCDGPNDTFMVNATVDIQSSNNGGRWDWRAGIAIPAQEATDLGYPAGQVGTEGTILSSNCYNNPSPTTDYGDLDGDACHDVNTSGNYSGQIMFELPCSQFPFSTAVDLVVGYYNSNSVRDGTAEIFTSSGQKCETQAGPSVIVDFPPIFFLDKNAGADTTTSFEITFTDVNGPASANVVGGADPVQVFPALGTLTGDTFSNAITFTETQTAGFDMTNFQCFETSGDAPVLINTAVYNAQNNSITIPANTVMNNMIIQCTATNAPAPGSLELTKSVQNGGYQGTISSASDWVLLYIDSGDASAVATSGVAITDLTPGTYTITEQYDANGLPYDVTVNCGNADFTPASNDITVTDGSEVTLGTVVVPSGGTVDCSITNTLQTAELTLVKTVDNGGFGTALATDWSLNFDGPGDADGFGVSGLENATSIVLPAGDYSLSESGGPVDANLYTLNSINCGAGDLALDENDAATISLSNGDQTTCTFTNAIATSQLTLFKALTNDDGGTYAIGDFSLLANNVAYTHNVTASVPSGDYTISESFAQINNIDPYIVTRIYCEDAEGIQVGDTDDLNTGVTDSLDITINAQDDITCTLYNDDVPSTFDMVKTFEITTDGGTLNSADVDDVVTYTYTFNNNGPWALATAGLATDSLLDVNDCDVTATPIAAGGSASCEIAYTVTQEDFDGAGNSTDTQVCTQGYGLVNSASPVVSVAGTETAPAETNDGNNSVTLCFGEQRAALSIEKTEDATGPLSEGDTVEYSFTVTNIGNVTLSDILVVDSHVTYAGPIALPLSNGGTTASLAPGAMVTFTANYQITQADSDAARDFNFLQINNTATATASGPNGQDLEETDNASVDIDAPTPLFTICQVEKDVDRKLVERGSLLNYTLTVRHTGGAACPDNYLIDELPGNLTFVPGTMDVNSIDISEGVASAAASLGGDDVLLNVSDNMRVLTLTGLDVPVNGTTIVTYSAQIGPTAPPGTYENIVSLYTGDDIFRNTASATVFIQAEPVFDCGDVIGKVFDDENQDGYQNQGERGIPGVKVVGTNGDVITTDAYGRFHVTCPMIPRDIGSNFVLKVDTRSLPTGYRLTTENPRAVRLTRGKVTKLNFGVSISKVVRIDLNRFAFDENGQPKPALLDGLSRVIDRIATDPSMVRMNYFVENDNEHAIGRERSRMIEQIIRQEWRKRGKYKLNIERTIFLPKKEG